MFNEAHSSFITSCCHYNTITPPPLILSTTFSLPVSTMMTSQSLACILTFDRTSSPHAHLLLSGDSAGQSLHGETTDHPKLWWIAAVRAASVSAWMRSSYILQEVQTTRSNSLGISGRVWRLQASPNMSLGRPVRCSRWGGSEMHKRAVVVTTST
jgi:hypothetical protein